MSGRGQHISRRGASDEEQLAFTLEQDRVLFTQNADKLRLGARAVQHAAYQATLPVHHGDPFDRLLAAQSAVEQMPVW